MAAPTCYWCEKAATSRDHVPPVTLFPKGRRTNLITVPSCYDHNEALSEGDEKFRFYLQACSDSPDALKLFETKTMRGLTRSEAAKQTAKLFEGSLRVLVPGGETRALQVNAAEQNLFFEKIVCGLYFHIFGKRAPKAVTTV